MPVIKKEKKPRKELSRGDKCCSVLHFQRMEQRNKRGRGRPRKEVVEPEIKEIRPRGRPRKSVVKQEPKEKRPRGRPRKLD